MKVGPSTDWKWFIVMFFTTHLLTAIVSKCVLLHIFSVHCFPALDMSLLCFLNVSVGSENPVITLIPAVTAKKKGSSSNALFEPETVTLGFKITTPSVVIFVLNYSF